MLEPAAWLDVEAGHPMIESVPYGAFAHVRRRAYPNDVLMPYARVKNRRGGTPTDLRTIAENALALA